MAKETLSHRASGHARRHSQPLLAHPPNALLHPPWAPTQARRSAPHARVRRKPEAEEAQLGEQRWRTSGCCYSNLDSTSHPAPARHPSLLPDQRPGRATVKHGH